MTIDIGPVGIWTAALDAQPFAAARDAVQELDELGFPALWINETTGRDPFVMASLLLSATSRLTVATGIANVYGRDAQAMSSSQKALAEAFPGRFLLGLGVSSPALVEQVRKHSFSKPLGYLRGYLDAMEAAPYKSVPPAGRSPLVLAALGPRMLRLAAERSDGAHPYLTTPEHTRRAREIMGPAAFLAPEQMVVLETDPLLARQIARRTISFYLPVPAYQANLRSLGFGDDDWAEPRSASDRLVDAIVAWGSIDAAVARIKEHHAAGADHVCVQVLSADPAELPLRQWRELASAVL